MSKTLVRERKPHEPKIISNGNPVIFAEGKIGAIVHFPVLVDEGSGYVAKVFEKFVRSPGTRILAVKDKKIYLQKEVRLEVDGFDWRLPGGKVVDSFADYKEYLIKPIPENLIIAAAAKELQEEAGFIAKSLKILSKKTCGATVEWDLYFILAEEISESKDAVNHFEGEEIIEARWFPFSEVRKMCESGLVREGRSAATIVEFLSR